MTKSEVMMLAMPVMAAAVWLPVGEIPALQHEATNTYEITDSVTGVDVRAEAGEVLRGKEGEISVKAGEGPISVREVLRYGNKKPSTAHTVENGTLKLVSSGCAGERKCSVQYMIHVPAGTAATVRTNIGDIDVHGLTGDLNLVADTGDVTGDAVGSKSVTLHSGAGDARADFTAPPDKVDVRADAGDVHLTLPAGSYDLQATAGAGDRRVSGNVTSDAGSPRKVRAVTGAGDVSIAGR